MRKFFRKMMKLCKTPSQYFREDIGKYLSLGFKIGIMKGVLKEIHYRRQKYILRWYFDTEYKPVQNAELAMRSTIARYEDDW